MRIRNYTIARQKQEFFKGTTLRRTDEDTAILMKRPVGCTVGGSPCSKPYFRAKVKVSVFGNGQFSRHLIFYKKSFFVEKKTFWHLWTSTLFFWKKSIFLFLKKKCFFGKFFFEEFFIKISKIFPPTKKLSNFFEIFSKKFPQKTFFFSKKEK